MNVRFLTDPTELRSQWSDIAALLAPVVDEAARGEFTLCDIRRLAEQGDMIVGTCCDAAGMKMAMAFEFKHYPQCMAINIVALGGRDLQAVAGAYWPMFRAWAAEAGASHIEALCSKAMARMLVRDHEFSNTYEQVRLPVQGAQHDRQ